METSLILYIVKLQVHLQKPVSTQHKQTPFHYLPYSTNHANLTSQTSRYLPSIDGMAFLPHLLLLSYYSGTESFLQLVGCNCWDDAVQMTFSSIESPKTGIHKSWASGYLTFMGTQSATVHVTHVAPTLLGDLCIPAINTLLGVHNVTRLLC